MRPRQAAVPKRGWLPDVAPRRSYLSVVRERSLYGAELLELSLAFERRTEANDTVLRSIPLATRKPVRRWLDWRTVGARVPTMLAAAASPPSPRIAAIGTSLPRPLVAASGPMLDVGVVQATRMHVPPPRPPGKRASEDSARGIGEKHEPQLPSQLAAEASGTPLNEWSVQEAVAWLSDKVDLAESSSNFYKAQVDGLTLPFLDAPALSELGVTSPLQQREVISAVRAIATEPLGANLGTGARAVRSWSTKDVSRWLGDVVGLPRYSRTWESAAIDGTVLCYLDRDSLVELGVRSALHRSLLLAEVRRLCQTVAPVGPVPSKTPAPLPESGPDPQPESTKLQPQPEPEPQPEPMSQSQPQPQPRPEPEPEPQSESKQTLPPRPEPRPHPELQPRREPEPKHGRSIVVVDAPVVAENQLAAAIGASVGESRLEPTMIPPRREHQQQAQADVRRWQRVQEQQAQDDARRWEQERQHRRQERERQQAQQADLRRREEQQLKRQRQQRHQQQQDREQQRRKQQQKHVERTDDSPAASPAPSAASVTHTPLPQMPAPPLVHSWGPGDVGSWIVQSVRLPQYASEFVKHEIDGALLAVLDDDSLRELGVSSAFHRLKIIHGVQKLCTVSGDAAEPAAGDALFNVPSWGTPIRNPGTNKSAAAEAIRAAKQEHEAATALQAAARGRQVRVRARKEADAATHVQSVARGRAVRVAHAREAAAATVLQRATRARAKRITRTRLERAQQQSVKPLISWTVAEVSSWLEHTVGLGEYVTLFEEHSVDGNLLAYLDKSSLEELGVPSALHRLKLLTALAQLPAVQHCLAETTAEPDVPAVASGATADEVRRATLALALERDVIADMHGSRYGSPSAMPQVYTYVGGSIDEQSWATGTDTPLPALRTLARNAEATSTGSVAAASPRLQQLEQFQQQQALAQDRRQQEQGVLGGLMRYQQHHQHQQEYEQEQQRQQDYSELVAQNEQLVGENEQLVGENEHLVGENEQLRQRLKETELLLASAAAAASQQGAATNTPAPPEAVPPTPPPSNGAGQYIDPCRDTLDKFLHPWFEKLREDLDELGVEAVDDLKELDADDLEGMASKLKKVPAKKFLKHVSAVVES